MTSNRADPAARRSSSLPVRIARAARALEPEQRLAAVAALALFLTLFLPWYSSTVSLSAGKHMQLGSPTFSGWEAFSFVEAAVLVVAICVLVLLFERAEGRAFHLPGGDGVAITLAGLWTCFLIVWRMFDKQGTTRQGQLLASAGIEWGIFVALFVAAGLAYAGTRIRAAHRPEPPLPMEDGAVFDGRWSDSRWPERSPVAAAVAAEAVSPPVAPPRPRRSSWRPAEQPEWSEPGQPEWSGSRKPPGWLTAPPAERPAPDDPEHPQAPVAPPEPDTEQLTIRFDDA